MLSSMTISQPSSMGSIKLSGISTQSQAEAQLGEIVRSARARVGVELRKLALDRASKDMKLQKNKKSKRAAKVRLREALQELESLDKNENVVVCTMKGMANQHGQPPVAHFANTSQFPILDVRLRKQVNGYWEAEKREIYRYSVNLWAAWPDTAWGEVELLCRKADVFQSQITALRHEAAQVDQEIERCRSANGDLKIVLAGIDEAIRALRARAGTLDQDLSHLAPANHNIWSKPCLYDLKGIHLWSELPKNNLHAPSIVKRYRACEEQRSLQVQARKQALAALQVDMQYKQQALDNLNAVYEDGKRSAIETRRAMKSDNTCFEPLPTIVAIPDEDMTSFAQNRQASIAQRVEQVQNLTRSACKLAIDRHYTKEKTAKSAVDELQQLLDDDLDLYREWYAEAQQLGRDAVAYARIVEVFEDEAELRTWPFAVLSQAIQQGHERPESLLFESISNALENDSTGYLQS